MSSEEASPFQRKFHLSNHWFSKAIRYPAGNYNIAPSQNTSDDFSFFPRWDVEVWRIPTVEPPKFWRLPPWSQLPPPATTGCVFGSRHELLSPKCSWKTQRKRPFFFYHLVKIGKSTKNWELWKSRFEVKISEQHGFCLHKWSYISLLGLGSGIKFPTPNIIYQKFHANLHSRLLISSISRFSHSFSKYHGKEKVCKQFCWSLQIRPSCFWNELKTLPNDFAGSNSKNLKYIMMR